MELSGDEKRLMFSRFDTVHECDSAIDETEMP